MTTMTVDDIYHYFVSKNSTKIQELNINLDEHEPFWDMETEYRGTWEKTQQGFHAMRNNSDPSWMTLYLDKINDIGSPVTANAIRETKLVEKLTMELDNYVQPFGLATLFYSLYVNTSIYYLRVYGDTPNIIHDGDHGIVLDVVENDSTNNITIPIFDDDDKEKLGSLLGSILKVNRVIETVIFLDCTPLSHLFFLPIIDGLRYNCTITKLDLSRCNLGDDGAIALAKLLFVNSSISDLCIIHNNISEIGADSIGQSLRYQLTIKKLDISYNPLRDNGFLHMFTALKYNISIVTIKMYDVEASDHVQNRVIGLERNREIGRDSDIPLWHYNSTVLQFHITLNLVYSVLNDDNVSSGLRNTFAFKKGSPRRVDTLSWLLQRWSETKKK